MLLVILRKLPLSTRLQTVDLVCRRWLLASRSAELWATVDLGMDPQWCSRVDYNLLNQLLYFSTGCRASMHRYLPRPCPIATLDLRTANCKLSAADLVKFCIRHIGPGLKELHAYNVQKHHNDSPLCFHLADMLYAVV